MKNPFAQTSQFGLITPLFYTGYITEAKISIETTRNYKMDIQFNCKKQYIKQKIIIC